MNKIEKDTKYGLLWRAHLIAELNNLFRNQIHFEFVHSSLRIDLQQLRENNTLLNRVAQKTEEEAVGLDLKATHLDSKKTINFVARRFNDPDMYLKKPSDVSADQYINTIKDKYFFLVVNSLVEETGLKYFHLSGVEDYAYNLSAARGNSSRLYALRKGTGKNSVKARPSSLPMTPVKGSDKKDMLSEYYKSLKQQIVDLF